jgi:two-component system response regulator YesN
MLRVLIVDDDFTARSNIKTMLDWNENGFMICGEASNGKVALEMIKEQQPDIVITDMKMPLLDGVGLIQYISKCYPAVKCIALSGYDDFEYVKHSLKNGAVDYLLKHKLDNTALMAVLKAAHEKISREHKVVEQFRQSQEILRRDFLKRLVLGEISEPKSIKENSAKFDMKLDQGNLALAIGTIDDYKLIKQRFSRTEAAEFAASLADLIEEILKDMGSASLTFVEEGKFVIMFNFGGVRSSLYIYNHMGTTIKRISTSIKRYLNITACFSLGQLFSNPGDIAGFYASADKILNRKVIDGKDHVFYESKQVDEDIDFLNLDVKDEKHILLAVKAGDMEQIRLQLDEIFKKITKSGVNYKSVQMICGELISIISRMAREAGIDMKEIFNNQEIPYEEMKKHETIMDVKAWITDAYQRLINLLVHVEICISYNTATRHAIEYIRRNYTEDISLNQAAAAIGVNSSYLSRVFKEDCKIGFTEYLNNVRVAQAKYLMECTDGKLKEIVSKVGFNNYTYFFKVFKMVVGVTPVEYKVKYLNGGIES